ncbi:exo-betaglucanase [Colletotrichum higginsianum]|nr:exo-betaglucanase [Colletotrichum higginsianum]
MTYFHLLLWLVIFSWSSTAQLRRRDPGLAEYIIYPKEEAAKGDLDVFHQTLEKLAGISNIETIIDDGGDSPFSWRASLTSEQLNEVENHPVVFATQVNKPTVFNPDPELDTNLRHSSIKPSRAKRATVSRTPIADNDMLDLRMASTPPGQNLLENYVSEDSAGAGITVYILEFDAVMFHKELFPRTAASRVDK